MEAEGRSQEFLSSEVEAFLVHTMARNFENINIWEKPIGISMLEAKILPRKQKKETMQKIGEECLFIDAWQLKQRRWPSVNYFQDMGQIAFGTAAISSEPIDELLDSVGSNFQKLSKVLRQVRDLSIR